MKNFKLAALTVAFAAFCLGIVPSYLEGNSLLNFANANECNHEGYHYEENEPSANSVGNKEFWACCKCHQQFLSKPYGTFLDNSLSYDLDNTHIAFIPAGERTINYTNMTLKEIDGRQYLQAFGTYTGYVTTKHLSFDLRTTNSDNTYTLHYGGPEQTILNLDSSTGKFEANVDITDMISMKAYVYFVPYLTIDGVETDLSTQKTNPTSRYLTTDNGTSQFRLEKTPGSGQLFKLVRQSVNQTIPSGAAITGYTSAEYVVENGRTMFVLSGTSTGHTRTSLCLNLPDFKITKGAFNINNMSSNALVRVVFDADTSDFKVKIDVTDFDTNNTAYKLNISKSNRTGNLTGTNLGYEGFQRLDYSMVNTTNVLVANNKKYSFVYDEKKTSYNGDLCLLVKPA